MFFWKQRAAKLRTGLPSARDISPTDGEFLDERAALKSFLGRDVQEALELLREHFEYYQENLFFMGRRGFEYYLEAVSLYVQEWNDEDFGGYAEYLIGLMEDRMDMEYANDFDKEHYMMTPDEMAANSHACAIRQHCIAELERLLAAGGTEWLAPAELREHLERWRGLF